MIGSFCLFCLMSAASSSSLCCGYSGKYRSTSGCFCILFFLVVVFSVVNPAEPAHRKGFRIVVMMRDGFRIATFGAWQSNQCATAEGISDRSVRNQSFWIIRTVFFDPLVLLACVPSVPSPNVLSSVAFYRHNDMTTAIGPAFKLILNGSSRRVSNAHGHNNKTLEMVENAQCASCLSPSQKS